jgi:hypothetical protein
MGSGENPAAVRHGRKADCRFAENLRLMQVEDE